MNPEAHEQTVVNPNIAVLLDFDGTLTQTDIGHMIMDAFACDDWLTIEDGWPDNNVSFRLLLEREYGLLPSSRVNEIERFAIEATEMRDGAVELIRYCVDRSISIEIVSGGLTNYISPILKHFDLPEIPISSLSADFSQGKNAVVTYPEGVVVCEGSGACKCARVRLHQCAGRTVIFAGDGSSDFCVAKEADVLFARLTLAAHCKSTGIPFLEFDSLNTVLRTVRELT